MQAEQRTDTRIAHEALKRDRRLALESAGRSMLFQQVANPLNAVIALKRLFDAGVKATPGLSVAAFHRYVNASPPLGLFALLFANGADPHEVVANSTTLEHEAIWVSALDFPNQAASILEALASLRGFTAAPVEYARARAALAKRGNPGLLRALEKLKPR